MFSEKTVELANKLKEVQNALDESIREDLGFSDYECSLCMHHGQIWFDDDAIEADKIKAMLPIESVRGGIVATDEHCYFKIGNMEFVTVLKRGDKR